MTTPNARPWLALVGLMVSTAPLAATTYLVGPVGRPFTQLTQVAPLVGPGDLVLVDGNATYNPVVFPAPGGAPGNPITVRGLRVAGARPILSGGTNTIEIQADHFVLESFEITGGSFRCVYHHSDDVVMRDLYVHDCAAHGILGADEDSGSLTLEYSEITRAGNGSSQHAIYMTTDQNAHAGSVFRMQHCYVHDQNGGNAVKTRAERNEIYDNWIEGTLYHLLELIGPDEGAVTPPPGIREDSDVVGNVLIHKAYAPPGHAAIDGNFYFVRIGSDMRCDDGGTNSTRGRYRFVNNTFVRTTGATGADVFRPFGYLQSVEMSNNVFASVPAVALQIIRSDNAERCWSDLEQIAGLKNWLQTGSTHVPTQWTGTLTGAEPGFANGAGFDYRLAAGSSVIDQGTATPTGPPGFPFPGPLFPPTLEPPPRSVANGPPGRLRVTVGSLDLGAFEWPGTLFSDTFESQTTGHWSATSP